MNHVHNLIKKTRKKTHAYVLTKGTQRLFLLFISNYFQYQVLTDSRSVRKALILLTTSSRYL